MIRFGISGCGGFAEKAILPLIANMPDAQVTTIYGGSSERLETIKQKFNVNRICGSYDELAGSDDVDAVYISSPNVFHKEQAIAAACAGKHILCEKPLGMNASECREIVDTCHKQAVKLTVDHWSPFAPAQQKVAQLVNEGVIGEVSFLYLSINVGGYSDLSAIGWRADPKKSGGGPLMDLAVHMVDLGCFFLDDKVKSIMAYVRPERTQTQIELDVRDSLDKDFEKY